MNKQKYTVVGVTFENRQDILNDFYKNYKHGGKYDVFLFKEDDNPYDANAISVNIEINGSIKRVGYISKKENIELRTKIEKIINAKVNSIGPNHNGDLGLSIEVEFNQ